MNQAKMIEDMEIAIGEALGLTYEGESLPFSLHTRNYLAKELVNAGCHKIADDEIVVKKSEYEKIKSLYDTQKGAIMTSSIGDLPLTIEGLRTAVDEITRLKRVQSELQELNAKYYNSAKDLRRELKKAKQETAREIFEDIEFYGVRSLNDKVWGNHFKLTDYTMLDLKMKYGIDKDRDIELEDNNDK